MIGIIPAQSTVQWHEISLISPHLYEPSDDKKPKCQDIDNVENILQIGQKLLANLPGYLISYLCYLHWQRTNYKYNQEYLCRTVSTNNPVLIPVF